MVSLLMAKQFVNAVRNLLILMLCVWLDQDLCLLTVMKKNGVETENELTYTYVYTQWGTERGRRIYFKCDDQNKIVNIFQKTTEKTHFMYMRGWELEHRTEDICGINFCTHGLLLMTRTIFKLKFVFILSKNARCSFFLKLIFCAMVWSWM